MDKSLVKLMRPYRTKLVKNETKKARYSETMLYLRPDSDSDDYIIVQVDKGFFDTKISFWRKNLQEERIAIDDVKPCIKIPFITPNYGKLFEVTDLDFVDVDTYDGTKRERVIAEDCGSDDLYAYHFSFEKVSVFHICEFAEKVNPNGNKVRMVTEEY